jgi:hypothetical protein
MLLAGLFVAVGAAPVRAGWNPFAPGTPVEVGPKSGDLAVADFNGDGHGDILANHPLDGRASLLLGDGKGEFPLAGRSTITFGFDAAAIAAGDFNGDQRPDLAAISRDGAIAVVHILLTGVEGRLKEFKSAGFEAGEIGERGWKPSLELADANGDKKLDLIVAHGRRNTVDVYFGSGAGQFALGPTVTGAEGFERYTSVVGDLNGDGRLDIVVAGAMLSGKAPGKLTVLVGKDKGELAAAPELACEIPAGAQVKALCDINGDALVDVALTHGASGTLLVQGKDGMLAPSAGSPFNIGHEAFGIAAVNVGLEGNDVLVAATVDSLDVVFQHEGEFSHACHTPMPAGPGAYHVATGDLNGDGQLDVVTNSFEGNVLTLLLTN